MADFKLASSADRVLWLLNRIEWQGDSIHYVCPSCRENRMHGHKPDCQLATLRAEAQLAKSAK